MIYATAQDVIDRYSKDTFLMLTERDLEEDSGNGYPDSDANNNYPDGDGYESSDSDGEAEPAPEQENTSVIDNALEDASAEIETYLAAKYSLPLPTVPQVLVRICVDIVVYRLASSADMATEEKRQRYEDAVGLLKRIAKGEVSLGLPEPAPTSNGGVHFVSQPKRFGRGRLL